MLKDHNKSYANLLSMLSPHNFPNYSSRSASERAFQPLSRDINPHEIVFFSFIDSARVPVTVCGKQQLANYGKILQTKNKCGNLLIIHNKLFQRLLTHKGQNRAYLNRKYPVRFCRQHKSLEYNFISFPSLLLSLSFSYTFLLLFKCIYLKLFRRCKLFCLRVFVVSCQA